MAKKAKMAFCITSSSVPSECLFSSTGDLIVEKKINTSPLVCARFIIIEQEQIRMVLI